MVVDDTAGLDEVFHALSDPTRREIVVTAMRGPQSVSALARRFPMSLTAVQKHVSVLERAGLITKQRFGREQLVHADIVPIQRAQRALDRLEQLWRARVASIDQILQAD